MKKQKPIKMKKKTAMMIGFLFSTSAIIVMIVFLMAKDKVAMRPLLFIGFGLALGSIVFRNLLRFKPGWFKDRPTREELDEKNN
jgi:uncharacterized membrane protein YwaF